MIREEIEKELTALRDRREGLTSAPDPWSAETKALIDKIGLRIFELEAQLFAIAEKMPRRY